MDLHAKDHPDVLGGPVGHDDAAERPVDDADAVAVPRADGQVGFPGGAGGMEPQQVVGVVGEVGVHLEDVVVVLLQGPAEAGQIGRAEAELAGAFD